MTSPASGAAGAAAPAIWTRSQARSWTTARRSSGSPRSPSRRRGRTCGSPPTRQPRAGDRARRPRPQAVPLPPRLPAQPEEDKFGDLAPFGEHLGSLRRRVRHDLRRAGRRRGPRHRRDRRACSTSPWSGSATRSTPARTRRSASRRSAIATSPSRGSTIRLRFKGKGAKGSTSPSTTRRLARLVRRCQRPARPGAVPVRRTTTARSRPVRSSDVNDYLSGTPRPTPRPRRSARGAASVFAAEPRWRPSRSPEIGPGGSVHGDGDAQGRLGRAQQHTGRVPAQLRAPRRRGPLPRRARLARAVGGLWPRLTRRSRPRNDGSSASIIGRTGLHPRHSFGRAAPPEPKEASWSGRSGGGGCGRGRPRRTASPRALDRGQGHSMTSSATSS